jgi:hypothetical protein
MLIMLRFGTTVNYTRIADGLNLPASGGLVRQYLAGSRPWAEKTKARQCPTLSLQPGANLPVV